MMAADSKKHPAHLKAVILDYGEVLCHRPPSEEFSRMAKYFGVGLEHFPELWERNRGPFDRGDLSPDKYWSMLAKDAGAKLSADQLDEICKFDLAMWSNVNSKMVDWVAGLHSTGLKVGLLSNMHHEMVQHCRKHFAWLKKFDFVTFSAEAGMIKPDPAIYEHTLRGLGVKPDEALFLDDREVNIEAARKLGIHAIRVQSMEQLRRDLHQAGFTILPEA
jgi:putative hydrolase of the HAD superfamily